MIAPINKDYFYSIVGLDRIDWRKLHGFCLSETKNKKRFLYKQKLYFQNIETNEVFVYLPEYRIALIPEFYPNLSISEDEEVIFSDWNIQILEGKPDKQYTINVFHRSTEYTYNSLTPELEKLLKDCSRKGRVLLTNDKIGYSREVEIFKDVDDWHKDLYLGYPEKLEIPLDMTKVSEMDNELINIMLWTQKGL